jgi:hypothetical protein
LATRIAARLGQSETFRPSLARTHTRTLGARRRREFIGADARRKRNKSYRSRADNDARPISTPPNEKARRMK